MATAGTVSYDSYGRPQSSTSPYGAVTNYGYSGASLPPFKTANTNSDFTTTVMDGFGRPLQTTTGYGSTTVSVVDTAYAPCGCSPLGKLSQQSQPYAPGGTDAWTTYQYDASGRTTRVTLPDGSFTSYLYEGASVIATDPAGNVKTFGMDAFGNLGIVLETDPNPALGTVTTSYAYDILNHLTVVYMLRGNVAQERLFNYTTNNTVGAYLLSATNPENGTVTYTYSGNLLASKTDAKGQQLTYQYDGYNRLKSVTWANAYPSAQVLRTYYYDTNPLDNTGFSQNTLGRLAAVQYPAQGGVQMNDMYSYVPFNAAGAGLPAAKRLQVNQTISYYIDNQNDTSTQPMTVNLDTNYSYNNEGGITSLSYPSTQSLGTPTAGPTYNYTYDSMYRLNGMTSGGSTVVANVSYNVANQLLTMYYGYNETRAYNTLGQLTGLNVQGPYGTVESLTYNYPTGSNNGKISSMYNAVSAETVTYAYDSLNRLATAAGSGWGDSYTYDGFGNLLQKNVTAGSAPSMNISVNQANNQIEGVYGVSYDANGNQNDGAYDVENRPINDGTQQYAYDAQNRRIWSWPDMGGRDTLGNATGYTVNMYSASGQKLGAYTFQPTTWEHGGFYTPVIQVTLSSSDAYFGSRRLAVMDQLGSAALTAGGQPGTFYPWGEARGNMNPQDAWSFATYWRDSSTGLDYAHNRYYSSQYGRFMTPDPSGDAWDPANPQSWNSYAYVLGDPINANDPGGLDCSSTQYYFNGVYQGTIGNIIAAQSDVSILATAMYTESGHGNGVDVTDEEYSIGAVIMNRWEFVNKNWYLSSSAGGPSLNVSGWGKPGDSITSIVENPSQFAIYVNNASGGISLSGGAQKNLNSALSSSADTSGCGDLAFALTLANGMWDERNDRNPLYLYNGLVLTGFNSFNPPHSSAPYEQTAGSFGDANTFYGVPESYVSDTPIRVRPPRPGPPRRRHDIEGQQ